MDKIGKQIVDNQYSNCNLLEINGKEFYVRQVFGFKNFNEENPFYIYNNVTFYNDVDCSDQVPDQYYVIYGFVKSIKTIADSENEFDINIDVLEVHDQNGLTNSETKISELVAGLLPKEATKYNVPGDQIYARIKLTMDSNDVSLAPSAISIPFGIGIDLSSSPSNRLMKDMMDVFLGGQQAKQAQAAAKASAVQLVEVR